MNIDEIKSPLPSREATVKNPAPIVAPENTIKMKETMETPENTAKITKSMPKPILMLAGFLVVIVVLFLVTRVLGKKTVGVVTLNYWGLWENQSVISGLIADFEVKNPGIKINYVENQKDNYRTRLSTRLASGENADAPDIFRVHQDWMPMFKDNLASVPSSTVTNLQLDTDFYQTYKEDLMVGGSYKAIPLMYDGLALFYNKDLLDSAQVSIPKTWWGLENAAMKLTVRDQVGNIKVAGAALGLTENVDHWSDIVGLMLKQNGVEVLKTDDINNKKLQDVLTYYTLFKTKDRVWDESMPSSTELFANGKLAFYFAPSWRVFNLEDMNRNLKYEITTVPQLPTLTDVPLDKVESGEMAGNLTNIHWGSYWVEGVSKNSKNQKEAWKFLEFMASKDSLEKMYMAASQIRNFGEIYPRKSMAVSIMANAKIKPFIGVADNATSWYLASRTFDDGINDSMIKYFKDALNKMTTSNVEAKDVMTDLRSGIGQVAQKYKISQ